MVASLAEYHEIFCPKPLAVTVVSYLTAPSSCSQFVQVSQFSVFGVLTLMYKWEVLLLLFLLQNYSPGKPVNLYPATFSLTVILYLDIDACYGLT